MPNEPVQRTLMLSLLTAPTLSRVPRAARLFRLPMPYTDWKHWEWLLQRQCQSSGLSLAAAAERLGAKSRNAHARYERGASVPTVVKLDELLQAVSGGRYFVLLPSPL